MARSPVTGRRQLLRIGSLACLVIAGTTRSGASEPDSETVTGAIALAALEQQSGGQLGVFAQPVGTQRSLSWHADTVFPMGSTFKAPLAALALKRVQDGVDTLATALAFGSSDLIAVSPVTRANLALGRLPIGTLVAAILERSDNTAANLLLRHVGGPAALTAFLRGIGDHVTLIRRGEGPDASLDGDNTTTPRAFATTLQTLCLGPVLQPELGRLLLRGMRDNQQGRTRLRATFPAAWTAADRTGTGDGLCNDGAIAWPPNTPPLVVSVFYRAPGLALPKQEAVLRTVGRMAAARFG